MCFRYNLNNQTMKKLISINVMLLMLFSSSIVFAQQNKTKTNNDNKVPVENTKNPVVNSKPVKNPTVNLNNQITPHKTNNDIIIDPKKPNNVITGNDTGQVDWTEQVIKAKGWSVIDTITFKNKAQAELMATRGAVVTAQRNLLETIQGVRVVSETTVRDCITTNDYIYTRIDGICKGAEMLGEPIIKKGIVEVILQIPIYKPANNSKDTASVASLIQKKYASNNQNIEKTAKVSDNQNNESSPSLLPVVKDENGNVVVDYSKYIDTKTGKFPKYLNYSKKLMEELKMKEGVALINAVQSNDGTIKIEQGQIEKVNQWGKIGKAALKIGKLILMII